MLFLSTAYLVYPECATNKYCCQHEFVHKCVFGAGPRPGPETY